MAESTQCLCAVVELADGASRSFAVQLAGLMQEIFLVRKNGRIVAYRNSCPHTGGPLDWTPGQFLNLDGDLIQCATHAALFRIEDGFCVRGPCAGARLSPVHLRIVDGMICIDNSGPHSGGE